mmetsp:Transcript_50617/g.122149  ORF Transcript_50617/g.122149 Transcript_50617/m.122149 type:complete len:116 (+) Transcript_50617:366-713(+)
MLILQKRSRTTSVRNSLDVKRVKKNQVRTTKSNLKDVNITETVENNVRAEQFGQEKADKSTRTTTKTNLKDVHITDTVEGDIRKEHHGRDKDWKETGRNQVKENTNFDMARALFN